MRKLRRGRIEREEWEMGGGEVRSPAMRSEV
jgi:hypothetical protein